MMEKVSSESDLEIELYSNAKERQAYDDQANLYAIIMATEHLERAYARDDLSQKEVRLDECMCVWRRLGNHRVTGRRRLTQHNTLFLTLLRLQYTTECNKLISQFRLAEKAALGKTMTIE